MAAEGRESLANVLWRDRWVVLLTALLVGGTVAAASELQTPVYETTAKLVVNQPTGGDRFGLSDSLQFYARTLGNLVGSDNVATEVVKGLPFPLTPRQARDRMSFSVVPETQLIGVTASDSDPQRAQALANAWASTFAGYARRNLTQAAPSSVSVADQATLPARPARPKPLLYTCVGLVVGALLGASAALARERLDPKVRTLERLTREFDLPVLGVLPKLGSTSAAQLRFHEAASLLRANLVLATDVPLHMIAVTSGRPAEGKSTVVAHLARAFATLALQDDAVLAVDADLRRPSLPQRLGVDADQVRASPGLLGYLRGTADVEWVALPTEHVGLKVIPSGTRPSPTADVVLSLPSSAERVRALAAKASVVLIDLPPLPVGAEVSVVAAAVEAVLLVVDPAIARRTELVRTVEQLRRVGARPLGFVVNRSADPAGQGYGYYGYQGGVGADPDAAAGDPTARPRRWGSRRAPAAE